MFRTLALATILTLPFAPAQGQITDDTQGEWQGELQDVPPVSQQYEWTIYNTCKERVHVAVYYAGEWNQPITSGWYTLEPGDSERFIVNSPEVAYYAYSQSYRWSGDDVGGPFRSIDLNGQFHYEYDDLLRRAGDRVRFRSTLVRGGTKVDC